MSLTLSGRSELQLASNLRGAASAEAVADGAVYQAAYHLLDPAARWPADGTPIRADRPGARVTVCIANEAGKINPNTASPGLLAALLRAAGADSGEANRLGTAIYAWHTSPGAGPGGAAYRLAGLSYAPSGQAFASVGELGLVLGMRPELLDRIRPALTVLSTEEVDPAAAGPLVLAALRILLGRDPRTDVVPFAAKLVTVTAVAQTANGGTYIRRAALRLTEGPAAPPATLTWDQGDAGDCR